MDRHASAAAGLTGRKPGTIVKMVASTRRAGCGFTCFYKSKLTAIRHRAYHPGILSWSDALLSLMSRSTEYGR